MQLHWLSGRGMVICPHHVDKMWTNDHPSPTNPGKWNLVSILNWSRIMEQQRSLSLGGEASDSPFVLVEFGGKLTKKERKFIYATGAGDLKWILHFLGNSLAFKRRLVRSRVTGLPFICNGHSSRFSKTDGIGLRRPRKWQEAVEWR